MSNAVIINPTHPANASVIWLHGLGADGHDFESIINYLPQSIIEYTRFIFPHAPLREITINMGMRMRAWCDVVSQNLTQQQDEVSIRESEQLIHTFIETELQAGITSQRIILAGFSQGGAIALDTGLRYSKALGGIIAISTYLPLADKLANERHNANINIPIFMGHGLHDPVIDITQGQQSKTQLESLGYQIQWHEYSMEHHINDKEIADIGEWLAARLC